MSIPVNAANLYVTYTDSHFVVIESVTEDHARRLDGNILGHYLSSDAANEAKATCKAIAALGFPMSRREKSPV